MADAIFTMTQLAAPNRIYQRSTKTGGGGGKGQGSIPATINVSSVGTIYARKRRVSDNAIIQASWLAGNASSTGSQTFNVAGIDVGRDQFYLDLSGDGSTWTNGTTPVSMGGLLFVCGQSHTSGLFNLNGGSGDSSTIADNGLTIPAEMRLFVNVDSGSSSIPSTWEQPVSGTTGRNSCGSVELASRLIAQLGIPIGIVAKTQGGTRLDQWLPGQTYGDAVAPTIAAAGGKVEAVLLGIGHNDAQYNYSQYRDILANLTTFWANVDAALGGAGTYQKVMFGVPNLTADAYNTNMASRAKVNTAFRAWAAANGAIFLSVQDIALGADHVHPGQAGNIRYGQHIYRAVRQTFGLASGDDRGPLITGITKSGLNLSAPVNHQTGATALVAVGDPKTRFHLAKRGDSAALALDGTTPLTVNAAELLFKFASDPGNGPIELFPMALHPSDNAAADAIYDDHTDGDGITRGRTLFAVPKGFDTRPKMDMTMTSPTYGATKFGGGLTGGRSAVAANLIPHPARGVTVEFFYKHLATSGSFKALGTFGLLGWWAIKDDILSQAGSNRPVTFTIGETCHIAIEYQPGKGFNIYKNGNALHTDPAGAYAAASGGNFTVRTLDFSTAYDMGSTGEMAHVAVFEGARYMGNFTPPSTEYAGDEPNLLHLWKFQSNGTDSQAQPAISATGAPTFAPMTSGAAATLALAGVAVATFGAMTGAAAAALAIAATASRTFGPLTSLASSALAITGMAGPVFAPLTSLSSGNLANPGSGNGSATITFGAMTGMSAAALAIAATASHTFAPLTSLASSALTIAGMAGPVFASLTALSSGNLANPGSGNGSATITFGAMTGGAAATLAISATTSPTFAPLTALSSGNLASPGSGSGSVAITFGAMTGVSAAALSIAATASRTFSPLMSLASSTLTIAGIAAPGFSPMTSLSAGVDELILPSIVIPTPISGHPNRNYPTPQNFSLSAGETKTLKVTVFGENGEPVPLADIQSVTWRLARTVRSAPILTKTTLSGVKVLTDDAGEGGANCGRLDVTIASADSNPLDGEYFHECQIVDASGARSAIFYGRANVTPSLN